MTDVLCCDICKEYDAFTPATIVFCIQRTDDPDATPQYVRCCDLHEAPAAVAAALIRSRLAAADVFRASLSGGAEQKPS
jgi:hypothetical protein